MVLGKDAQHLKEMERYMQITSSNKMVEAMTLRGFVGDGLVNLIWTLLIVILIWYMQSVVWRMFSPRNWSECFCCMPREKLRRERQAMDVFLHDEREGQGQPLRCSYGRYDA